MASTARQRSDLLSLYEFEHRSSGDDYREELVRGVLVREPPPASRHGWLQSRISSLLAEHAGRNDLGLVLVETGFILADDPATVRAPDVSFVARDRAAGYPSDRYGRTPPDLAVEIVSPSDRASAILEKVFDYLDAGVRMVWVVDPASRSVSVYRSRSDIRILRVGDVLEGGEVVVGLSIEMARLFG